ncbi:MAG: ShlB/FhaC/HecB family hemolysin secretion/activation protein [Leptolyngbyaceae cyanobacterium SL_7_1]|nr:ShlB/FhaC/HecB family hemolysin secretion/activation protein [Leptolyngbyaceae cyanobacterium SL_7_1]
MVASCWFIALLRRSIVLTILLLISPSVYSAELNKSADKSSTVVNSRFIAQIPPRPEEPPSLEPLPEPQLPPPPDTILDIPTPPPIAPTEDIPETIVVERFEFLGNTVFSDEELATATTEYINRPITIDELYEARSIVNQRYLEAGYATSGAFIPPQRLQEGVVVVQVIEGTLEAIDIRGLDRVNDGYVRSRIELAATTPLNVDRLLQGLRLLQLDPLIENLSAELAAGPRLGTSLLTVNVIEADTDDVFVQVDNNRSPSVGSDRVQLELRELNVAGSGEAIDFTYEHTEGSDALEGSARFFLNPRNGTLAFSTGVARGEIIEEPFDELNINANSNYLELTYRQPIVRTPTQEFALGITASRQEVQSRISLPEIAGGDIPLTLGGANEDGFSRVTAVRFFQEWTQQSDRQVFAVRSQFSLGLDALGSTVNNDGRPDSRFLAWRGQTQFVRLLAPDTLLLLRSDLQVADDSLMSLEQYGLGGQQTIRGYRQDVLLTDSALLASAEVRLPILRVRELEGVLQVAPFIDFGTAWNVDLEDPDPQTLVGIGAGLVWRQERLTARLDIGIPLVEVEARERTWQENGVYFSIVFNPF